MALDTKEIYEMVLNANNSQDGVIVALGFDGLSFKNGCREFTHLTKSHVDFENSLIHVSGYMLNKNNSKPRQVPISENTKQLIKQVLKQKVYISTEGEKVALTESEYVLRGISNDTQVNREEVHQRIARVAKENDYEYLNATTISQSGQLYYTKQLLNDGMELDAAVIEILQRFGVEDNCSSQHCLKQRVLMDLNGMEIPLSQEYFWTEEWQEKLKHSREDLAKGEYKIFKSVDELFRHFGRYEKEEDD